jgi:hypothetical protein
VADPAAAVVQAVEVAVRAAVVLPAAKAVVEASPAAVDKVDKVAAGVVANPAVAADKVVEVEVSPAAVVAAVNPAAAAKVVEARAAARVVEARAVVVDAHRAVADKVVAAGVNPVVAVDRAVVVAGWEEEAVVAVRPEAVAGAAESLNPSSARGASRSCGAPFFY